MKTLCLSQDAKKLGASPLSQYVLALRQRAQQRNASLTESRFMIYVIYRLQYIFMFPSFKLQFCDVYVYMDSVFLLASIPLSSQGRYQKVMKRMLQRMKKVLLSLVPHGYQEVIPSMSSSPSLRFLSLWFCCYLLFYYRFTVPSPKK